MWPVMRAPRTSRRHKNIKKMSKESTIKKITIAVIAGLIIAFICWLFTPLGDIIMGFFSKSNETSEVIIPEKETTDSDQKPPVDSITVTKDTLENITTEDTTENLDYYTDSIMEGENYTEDITTEGTVGTQEHPTLSMAELEALLNKINRENTADSIAEEDSFGDITAEETANNQQYPVREEESNNFIFKVTNCELSGNLLIVEMFITNIDNEKRSSINRDTYFIDDNGHTYYLRKIQIGGQKRISANFPKNIPLKVTLEFTDINIDFKSIKLFRLVFGNFDHFNIDFPDLYMRKK